MFSLQKICLDFIVKNFETYYFIFSELNHEMWLRQLQFLQRNFSLQLLAALYGNQTLKDEYFDFLINKHLIYLDGKWFKNSRYKKCMKDIFSRLPNLKVICFDYFDDKCLKHLTKLCPKIIEIDLRHSNVTDSGIKYLCKNKNGMVPFPELKNVFLGSSRIANRSVKNLLQNLQQLERIDYPGIPRLLHSIQRKNIPKSKEVHYNLVELNFSQNLINLPYYTDVLETCLAVCPKLESIDCCISQKEQLKFFSNCRLKKLSVYCIGPAQKMNMDDFLKENGSSLTLLKLSDCTISVSLLAFHCPVLQKFRALQVKFTHDEGIQSKFYALIRCALAEIDSSYMESACSLFSSSPNLKAILLHSCVLSVRLKAQILAWCQQPSAKELGFSLLRLEIGFLQDVLLRCPSLKLLYLNVCSFDVQDPKEALFNFVQSINSKTYIFFKE